VEIEASYSFETLTDTAAYSYVSRGLPAFYVNVIFVNTDETNLWIGGEPKKNFVRITIEQIARTMPNPDNEAGKAFRTAWMDEINEVCYNVLGLA
jgi:hypothetical protein